MPAAERFFDTNVLLYLISDDQAKAGRAEAELAEGGAISVQVLNEFTHVARRKAGLDWDEIGILVETFRATLTVMPLTEALHDRARIVAAETGYSIYDALIVAAAEASGAGELITEDLQHDRRIGDLVIRNPFIDAGNED